MILSKNGSSFCKSNVLQQQPQINCSKRSVSMVAEASWKLLQ
jgi:hypothetical protein